jgi:hypothetical protein
MRARVGQRVSFESLDRPMHVPARLGTRLSHSSSITSSVRHAASSFTAGIVVADEVGREVRRGRRLFFGRLPDFGMTPRSTASCPPGSSSSGSCGRPARPWQARDR